jgi:hypothetical protein
MPNAQCPINDQVRNPNEGRTSSSPPRFFIRAWGLIGHWDFVIRHSWLCLCVSVVSLLGLLPGTGCATKPTKLVPRIDSEWWSIADDPDLGELTDPAQQPVDFGIWQAADGTWQLWSCIRGTRCDGRTRLLYRWEAQNLTDRDWTPLGIAMQADPAYGETPGGLQAPYVLKIGSVWHMFYGDWVNICIARSTDGKQFERWLYPDGRAGMFSEGPDANARDAMAIRTRGQWYCYYTAFPGNTGSVFCRTSKDLRNWSESTIVGRGGRTGTAFNSAECPFVVERDGYYYLFRTQRYGEHPLTTVYRSPDPLDFGVENDDYFIRELPVAAPEIILHDGQYYIASLKRSLKGIEMARLAWDVDDREVPE